MSLRRPFRDSWENREYKRVARSLSPAKEHPTWKPVRRASPSSPQPPRPELYTLSSPDVGKPDERYRIYVEPYLSEVSDSDDEDYPDKQALTPGPQIHDGGSSIGNISEDPVKKIDEHFKRSTSDLYARVEELVRPQSAPTDVDRQISTNIKDDYVLPQTTYDPSSTAVSPSRSFASTLRPSDSFSQRTSRDSTLLSFPAAPRPLPHPSLSAAASNPRKADQEAELQYLHSNDFPIQFLRPVPDFITLMTHIAPVIGDPGTGPVKFGPQSPRKPVFLEGPQWMHEAEEARLHSSILRDKEASTNAGCVWESKPPKTTKRSSSNTTISTPSSSSTQWRGRKYSVNPDLKTRLLSFEVLQRKISHGELLSLNISVDARRDAISIGGGAADIGGSMLDVGRGASRKGLSTDTSSDKTSIGGSTSRSRSRTSARDSHITTQTLPSTRASTFNSGLSRPSRNTTILASTPRTNDSIEGYDSKERRWRAQGVDNSFETGRYGIGGMMLWRLVKVTAKVEIDGEEQEQVAWYCVPDRVMGGWF